MPLRHLILDELQLVGKWQFLSVYVVTGKVFVRTISYLFRWQRLELSFIVLQPARVCEIRECRNKPKKSQRRGYASRYLKDFRHATSTPLRPFTDVVDNATVYIS